MGNVVNMKTRLVKKMYKILDELVLLNATPNPNWKIVAEKEEELKKVMRKVRAVRVNEER